MSQNAVAVLAEVAERVKGSNSSVRERVVGAMVEKEVASRAELLAKSLDKLAELGKGLKKMRPDIETVSADGTQSSASWSKKAYDEYKKAKEKHEGLEKAIGAALGDGLSEEDAAKGTNDAWTKLRDVLQKVGNAGGGGDKAE